MYNGLPKFVVFNQKEESISIQRVNKCISIFVKTVLWTVSEEKLQEYESNDNICRIYRNK